MKEIWAYCRVSSKLQAYSEEESLSTQINRCKLYGASRTYFDIDKRTKDIRPGLSQLLEDIEKLKPGEVSELVFTRLDRVAASSVAFYTLLRALDKKNIKPVAMDDSLDLESVGGELSADIRLAVSKHEVKMLGLRVRKALEYRKLQGIPHKLPFGYVLSDNQIAFDYTPVLCNMRDKLEYSVHDVVKKIFEVFDRTHSIRGTSFWINDYFGLSSSVDKRKQRSNHVIKANEPIKLPPQNNAGKRFPHCTLRFSVKTISNLLKNPIYSGSVGTSIQHDKTYISEDERLKILEIIESNKCNPKSDRTRNKNEYSGKIRCSVCGGTVTRVFSNGRKEPYYYCLNAKSNGNCSNKKFITKSNLDKQVVEQLRDNAITLAERALTFKNQKEIKDTPEVKKLKKQIKALKQITPSSVEIEDVIKSLQIKLESELVKTIELKSDNDTLRREFISAFSYLDYEIWSNFSVLDKIKLLDLYVDFITLSTNKTVTVNLRFN
ncbi:recombinase family protein [Plectonema cf. radiosum LEGE 06105]|uniref:Recombinase family protein n=1 Tax=Plectonema cf. radiosum LEGE 06105 TaxID=945769 RepID=A0A8J7F741_9CYAN|nr:fdxN element excision recombinase XisF [Plectonema radiosum]MBE9215270.1 recombinase family protein [Plectonema cf. radiosum LEGE 06105]